MHFQNRSVTRNVLLPHAPETLFRQAENMSQRTMHRRYFDVAVRLCSRRQQADLLSTGGVVRAGEAAAPVAEAVSPSANRITDIGTAATPSDYQSAGTPTSDLGERFVAPASVMITRMS